MSPSFRRGRYDGQVRQKLYPLRHVRICRPENITVYERYIPTERRPVGTHTCGHVARCIGTPAESIYYLTSVTFDSNFRVGMRRRRDGFYYYCCCCCYYRRFVAVLFFLFSHIYIHVVVGVCVCDDDAYCCTGRGGIDINAREQRNNDGEEKKRVVKAKRLRNEREKTKKKSSQSIPRAYCCCCTCV